MYPPILNRIGSCEVERQQRRKLKKRIREILRSSSWKTCRATNFIGSMGWKNGLKKYDSESDALNIFVQIHTAVSGLRP